MTFVIDFDYVKTVWKGVILFDCGSVRIYGCLSGLRLDYILKRRTAGLDYSGGWATRIYAHLLNLIININVNLVLAEL